MPMDDSAGTGWITRPMQRYIEACQLQHRGIRLPATNFVWLGPGAFSVHEPNGTKRTRNGQYSSTFLILIIQFDTGLMASLKSRTDEQHLWSNLDESICYLNGVKGVWMEYYPWRACGALAGGFIRIDGRLWALLAKQNENFVKNIASCALVTLLERSVLSEPTNSTQLKLWWWSIDTFLWLFMEECDWNCAGKLSAAFSNYFVYPIVSFNQAHRFYFQSSWCPKCSLLSYQRRAGAGRFQTAWKCKTWTLLEILAAAVWEKHSSNCRVSTKRLNIC